MDPYTKEQLGEELAYRRNMPGAAQRASPENLARIAEIERLLAPNTPRKAKAAHLTPAPAPMTAPAPATEPSAPVLVVDLLKEPIPCLPEPYSQPLQPAAA